jgi:hypothetical protein
MSDKIILAVSGGIVSILEKPDNVNVEIRDYDVEGDWDEENIGCKKDKDGDRYQEFLFPATEIKFSANGKQCFTDVERKLIGWQPHEEDFPAGLHTFEVYEDFEMAKGCHPEVKEWIEIFEGMIEKPVIIPSDKDDC